MANYRLIVTEKPSVARDIGRVLGVQRKGAGYLHQGDTRITWCVGHLLQLAEPSDYNPQWRPWRLQTLPMIPARFELRPRDTARDQCSVVMEQLRGAKEVINACDAGREGELIFAWAYQHAQAAAPVKRLWISSMTDAAIRGGFKQLRDGSEMASLEAAARCRAEADWLVGLNATRAMTTRFATGPDRALLSVGRVQTPTLALLCSREDEIDAFEPQDFWTIKARLSSDKGQWDATWTRVKDVKDIKVTDSAGARTRSSADGGQSAERLWDEAEAEAIVARLQQARGSLTHVERKESRERPPQLHDLTTLQKDANRRFKFSAKRVLEIAQSLYETHKLLTYPRTDSRHLGSDQLPGLPDVVRSFQFGPYAATAEDVLQRWPIKLSKRVVDDKEVSDHHAIIPTGNDPRHARLNIDEKRVFDLVARRFLAVMMPDAVFAVARMDASFGADVLTARGRTCLTEGWRSIDPPQSKKKEILLPPVEKGEVVDVLTCKSQKGTTKPPRRFTEGTLLAAMEGAGESLQDADMKRAMKRNGLGTAATRAAIIETLLARGYAERESNAIIATPHGRQLLRNLPVQGLTSPRLTGAWEARLVAMAEGKEAREAFMSDIIEYARELVEQIRAVSADAVQAAGFRAPPPTGEILGTCPNCAGEVRSGRRGWGCVSCALRIPSMVARRQISPTMAKALLKKQVTKPVKGFKARSGRAFSAALRLDADWSVKFDFPEQAELGACPACSKPVRARGRVFTCDTGRDCSFVVFAEMAGHMVTDEEVAALLRDGQTSYIHGFVGRDGRHFGGVLAWHEGRVRAVASDERSEAATVGTCPRCDNPVRFRRGSWRCQACSFQLPGSYFQRRLLTEDAVELLKRGRTHRLHGFRRNDSATKPFKAALVLDDEGRLRFDYSSDASERPIPEGGPAPAFGQRVDCPCCAAAEDIKPGYVIAGKQAWGCSKWRAGCKLRVPFVIGGVELSAAQARRLMGKHRATRYESAFAQRGTARVELLPGQDPCWRVQQRTQASAGRS